jgi:hypothetical protein
MVVYTIGNATTPALTAQARPQDGEIFGEFPPRRELSKYTKFPVIVPSSTPAYNSVYPEQYLISLAKDQIPDSLHYIEELFHNIETPAVKGYVILLMNYLIEACSPREGHGIRTSLYGMQKPPEGSVTEIRCELHTTLDEAISYLLPFYVTNAREYVVVSYHPDNASLAFKLKTLKDITLREESTHDFHNRIKQQHPWNVIQPGAFSEYPLVGNFISQILPLGHIKSTKTNDSLFKRNFLTSTKWLHIRKV